METTVTPKGAILNYANKHPRIDSVPTKGIQ